MQAQNELQGIYDERVSHLNKFRIGMADIALRRHPLAQVVGVTLMSKEEDIYGDTSNEVEVRVDKLALVNKSPDLSYVQDYFDDLIEDVDDKIPWLVKMTITGLPRLINHDDRILIADEVYSVSKVSPINRMNDGLLKVLVYPERSNPELV